MDDRKETVEFLLRIYRPGAERKKGALYNVLSTGLGADTPNKDQSIEGRTLDALQSFKRKLYFLAGVLTMFPFLKHQNSMLKFEGEKLLLEGHQMRTDLKASTASIRRLRIHGEKILRLVKKIEKTVA